MFLLYFKSEGVADSLDFIQVYFQEEQKNELYDFATPYFNEHLTRYFENAIIADLVPKCNADLIGVASWRLRKKRGDCVYPLKNNLTLTAEKIINSAADVAILTPRSPIHKPLLAAVNWHGKAWVEAFHVFKGFLRSLGITVPDELRYAIYENHFVARREVYHDYVRILKLSIQFMEDEAIFLTPSGYNEKKRNPKDAKRIKELLGLSDYPIGVFILERLFSIYINDKNLNVKPV